METTQLSLALPAAPRDQPCDDGAKDVPPDPAKLVGSALRSRFLTAPMILHGAGSWETDVPDWMRAGLPQARAAYLEAGGDPDLACELDAVVYLMTASLEQPLDSEWTRIYLHIAFKALRDDGMTKNAAPGAASNDMPSGHVEIPDEDWVRDADKPLSRDEARRLDELRSQIRQSQRRHAKTKRRGRSQAASNESEVNHEAT